MKKLLAAFLMTFSICNANEIPKQPTEKKQVCIETVEQGKKITKCRKMKIHQKFDGDKIPEKK